MARCEVDRDETTKLDPTLRRANTGLGACTQPVDGLLAD